MVRFWFCKNQLKGLFKTKLFCQSTYHFKTSPRGVNWGGVLSKAWRGALCRGFMQCMQRRICLTGCTTVQYKKTWERVKVLSIGQIKTFCLYFLWKWKPRHNPNTNSSDWFQNQQIIFCKMFMRHIFAAIWCDTSE